MIEIINQQKRHKINKNNFKNLLKRLVEFYKLEDPDVTLAFVNNGTIKELNNRFLNKNAPTDVLSFPINEKGADGKFYLGDIIICVPQASKQCFSKKHDLEREMELLTIHGFLHLLGFEHFAEMEEEENTIRNLLLEGEHGN